MNGACWKVSLALPDSRLRSPALPWRSAEDVQFYKMNIKLAHARASTHVRAESSLCNRAWHLAGVAYGLQLLWFR